MNITQFQNHSCFALLDLEADFQFKTETSISFAVGKFSRNRVGFVQKGWLDIHHPAEDEGWPKAFLRIALPENYVQPEQQQQIIKTVFEVLEISPSTLYEADFITVQRLVRIIG